MGEEKVVVSDSKSKGNSVPGMMAGNLQLCQRTFDCVSAFPHAGHLQTIQDGQRLNEKHLYFPLGKVTNSVQLQVSLSTHSGKVGAVRQVQQVDTSRKSEAQLACRL